MRIAASLLLCVALSAPAFAGTPRPAPNAPSDDSPIARQVKRVVRATVKALGHLIVQPLDDGPDIVWPKP